MEKEERATEVVVQSSAHRTGQSQCRGTRLDTGVGSASASQELAAATPPVGVRFPPGRGERPGPSERAAQPHLSRTDINLST